jgi:hypothetical protein
LIGAYITQLGYPEKTIAYVTKAPPKSVTILTSADAKKYAIGAEQLSRNEALRYVTAAAAPVITPPILSVRGAPSTPVSNPSPDGMNKRLLEAAYRRYFEALP